MGDLIYLAERAADRSRPVASSSAFYFALDCPLSYLAAERVERTMGHIDWIPVLTGHNTPGSRASSGYSLEQWNQKFAAAKHLAATFKLPLVAPDKQPLGGLRAARAAVFAEQVGGPDCTRRFALAMFRLGFCGGFDIDERSVLADAAAAAGLEPSDVLKATREVGYDLRLEATTAGLLRRGAPSAPAIRIGEQWFGGADPLLTISA